MTRFLTILILFLVALSTASAQVAPDRAIKPKPTEAPNRGSLPAQEYPITNLVRTDALAAFTNDFELTNVGFMHVYIDPAINPTETYLMEGKELSSTSRALLPAKLQQQAKSMNAKVYGAAEIAGKNESLYLIRMDGQRSDRIEMVANRDGKIVHLKTIAYRECAEGNCRQLDGFLTDVDGDGTVDLIQRRRVATRNGDKVSKPKAYIMHDSKKQWKRARGLDLPLNSLTVYRRATDD